MNYKISAMFFSPTGTTKKIIYGIAKRIEENMDYKTKINYVDFTKPSIRNISISFDANDILIIGVPVYAGRVPNVLLKYLNTIVGFGSYAIPIVVYGNRNYDDALIELKNILEKNGFNIIAAGAFIGEHSFSDSLAKGRPDNMDMSMVNQFDDSIVKLFDKFPAKSISVLGQVPLRPYFQPKDRNGDPFNFTKIIPKTNENCNNCKLCVELCPIGSIDKDDVSKLNGICIKCCACIKGCPTKAKYFDDLNYLKHKLELEYNYSIRREPKIFI